MEIVSKKEVKSEFLEKLYDIMKAGCKPMTEEQTKVLFTLIMNKDQFREFDLDMDNEKHVEFARIFNASETIMYKRCLEQYGLKLDLASRLFLAQFLSMPGEMVLMGTYIAHYMYKHKMRTMTLDQMCEGPIAMGIPSSEAMQKAWELNKAPHEPGSNMLDNSSLYTHLIEWKNASES